MAKYLSDDEIKEEVTPIMEKKNDSGMVTLIFNETRTFELHVDGQVYRFVGQEPVQVPASVLTSPDFHGDVKQYFIVRK